ncbi:Major Facilitator Superfamily protein [Parafrankia irregularis]|uniref:Major Facilitator Superfamily protein n=1 Tax=Parafrankia irregularis TaxID=795642 RepID=A0A0S4QWV7_9ACTN|nr:MULTISPECIES: MFS transporter [Parafrankia]MBE3205757.1 MFS transporter [Parafrankia sp. CH37]CUU59631.1 Major Facilitator Superfamily protein [Parafrankia irregularis]
MRELLRNREFAFLFVGQVTSMIGESIMLIVLAIWVKELTGSSGQAGAVVLAVAAPALVAPLLGWAVDRVRRRPFLLWVNLLSAVALLPLLAVRDRHEVWIVFAVSVAYGFSFSLNTAGLAGLLKVTVAGDRLVEANSLLRSVREGSRLLGPLAGAGLYAWAGVSAVVIVDAATFVIAAVTLTAMRVVEDRPRPTELHWAAEAGAGFRHLAGEAALLRCAIAMGLAFLVFGAVNPGVFAYVDQGLHRPATFVGVLMTVMGLGAVLGALAAPKLVRVLGESAAVAVGLGALGAGLAALVYPRLWLGLAVAPVVGFGVSVVAIAFTTLMQRRTPAPLMGRVSTATDLLVGAPQTASIAAGAVLVSVVDFRWLFGGAAAALLIAASGLWTVRERVSAGGEDGDGPPDGDSAEKRGGAEKGDGVEKGDGAENGYGAESAGSGGAGSGSVPGSGNQDLILQDQT